MYPFSKSATSTPDGRINKSSGRSSNNESNHKSLYFSRFHSSPVSRTTGFLSPGVPLSSPNRNQALRRELPLSLLNFQSPVRRQPPIQQTSAHSRKPVNFFSYSTTSMMERALRILESKKSKRHADSFQSDDVEIDTNSIKHCKCTEENNSNQSSKTAVNVQDPNNNISRPKLKPFTFTRPSSSKLPNRVSRLSSATLEAIAFSGKRPRSDDMQEFKTTSFMINEDFSSPILPPAKRRDTRDCETQTLREVEVQHPTPEAPDITPPKLVKTCTVSRFIAGLEARARVCALNKRTTSIPLSTFSPANSLEARHNSIKRLFADLAEKAPPIAAKELNTTTSMASDGAPSSHLLTAVTSPTSANAQPFVPVSTTCESPVGIPPFCQLSEPASVVSFSTDGLNAANVTATSNSVAPVFTFSFAKSTESAVSSRSSDLLLNAAGEKKLSSILTSSSTPSVTPTAVSNLPGTTMLVKPNISKSALSESTDSQPTTGLNPSFSIGDGSNPLNRQTTTSKLAPTVSGTNITALGTEGSSITAPAMSNTATSFIFSTGKGVGLDSNKTNTLLSSSSSMFSFPKTSTVTTQSQFSVTPTHTPGSSSTAGEAHSSSAVFSAPITVPSADAGKSLFKLAKTNKLASSSTPTFSFATSTTPVSTAKLGGPDAAKLPTVSESGTPVSLFKFSVPPSPTSASNIPLHSTSSVLAFPSNTFTTNTSPFTFALKPPDATTTASTNDTPGFSFSTKPTKTDASSTTNSFDLQAKTVPIFNFSKTTSVSTLANTSSPVFSFVPASTNSNVVNPFAIPPASVSLSVTTTSVFSPFNFSTPAITTPSSKIAPANCSPFTFPTTTGSAASSGKGNLFDTVVAPSALPSFSIGKSSTSAIAKEDALALPASTTANITKVIKGSVSSFNFSTPATTLSGGFNFSSVPSVPASNSTLFAPKSESVTSGAFQFGTTSTTSTSSNFAFGLTATKSLPSIFSVGDHTKRTANSAFGEQPSTTSLGNAKISAPIFGQPTSISSPFGNVTSACAFGSPVPAATSKPFSFGAISTPANNTVENGGVGFNFGTPATNDGGFSFDKAPTPFGQSSTVNPFNVGAPATPNAAASFQQRRRQMRLTKRR